MAEVAYGFPVDVNAVCTIGDIFIHWEFIILLKARRIHYFCKGEDNDRPTKHEDRQIFNNFCTAQFKCSSLFKNKLLQSFPRNNNHNKGRLAFRFVETVKQVGVKKTSFNGSTVAWLMLVNASQWYGL